MPRFQCLLVDLMAIDPEELPSSDQRLHSVLSVMRSVFGDDVDGALQDMAIRLATAVDRPEVRRVVEAILNCALPSAKQMTNEGFLTAVHSLGKMGDDMMSTLIDKWKEEGREQGLEQGRAKGRIEDRQESVIDIPEARFGSVPDAARDAVRAITDAERLKQLTAVAAICKSVDEFVDQLK